MYAPPPEHGGRPNQSRIVVDVDEIQRQQQAAQSSRRDGRRRWRSRGRRVLSVVGLILVGAVLLAVVGGYWWWRNYQESPAYALALLVDAARRNDQQAIDKLIDSDRVAQSLAPQVIDKALANVGGLATLAAPRRQIELALPNLLPYARDQVRDEIAKGAHEVAAKTSDRLPFFVMAIAVPRLLQSMKVDGDAATAVINHAGRSTELTLERAPEQPWKIVGLKDDALATNIAARVIGSLPVPGSAGRLPENQTRRPARPTQP